MAAYVIKHEAATIGRIERFLSEEWYTSCNLRGRLYPSKVGLTSIQHHAPGKIVPYSEAVTGTYKPVNVPSTYGPLWSTHWFRLSLDIPRDWVGQEVRLIWKTTCESMVWENGQPKQGLSGFPRHMVWRDFVLSTDLKEAERSRELYIEMACTGLAGQPKHFSSILDPDTEMTFDVEEAYMAVIDKDVFDLYYDLQVLLQIAQGLPDSSHRGKQAMYAANEMINVIRLDDKTTYLRARDLAKTFFSQRNGDSQFQVHAMGHCHIDSTWLWSYDETIRKCARSWVTALRLMEQYPEMTFVCSQAQQFAWVQEHYPGLFTRIKDMVNAGRFIPVGGSWVEMDGNLPSGESFVRHVLYGQRYFRKEFGITCKEFWLPDTFGYSGQLPQIVRSGEMDRFLTQKISWSVNKFPHHSFHWEGIDGTRVLTHFPPGDCYHMNGSVKEIMKTKNNCEDKGRCYNSAFLYGYGDGGGGVTEAMLERMKRLEDVDEIPKVVHSTPEKLFREIETKETNICHWVGELYLEFHQGTYTSQAQTKRYNRQCEVLLHNAEFLAAVSQVLGLASYPSDSLDQAWKKVLLNQFHDVLPGSSIGKVYQDSSKLYEEVIVVGNKVISENIPSITNKFCKPDPDTSGSSSLLAVINTVGWDRDVVDVVEGNPVLARGRSYGVFAGPADVPRPDQLVSVTEQEKTVTVENQYLSAKLDRNGRIVSLKATGSEKEAILDGRYGNQFVIFDDTPVYWDAWDVNHYHLQTRTELNNVTQALHVTRSSGILCELQCTLKISANSTLVQTVRLDAVSKYIKITCEVEWNEDHKFLKVEFPFNIRSAAATYEIQHGHIQRPTHWNTELHWMKFEVPAQKWADLSEHGFGVALLNDCKHGHSTHGNVMRISLLKSAKAPDKNADMGSHVFSYGIMPHTGSFQEAGVIKEAHSFNNPARVSVRPGRGIASTNVSFFSVDQPGVVIDTVKCHEDDHNVVVLRMYEAFGGQTTARISTWFTVTDVTPCNILETPLSGEAKHVAWLQDGVVMVTLAPFKLVTLALKVKLP